MNLLLRYFFPYFIQLLLQEPLRSHKLYMFFPPTGDVVDHNDSSKDLVKMQFQAVLAEYNDLRDEVKRRIDHRTHISYFVIAVILSISGLYIASGNLLLVVLIPSVLIYWLFIISSSYAHHLDIVTYIREEIEGKKLPQLIREFNGKGWIAWETYYFDRKKIYSSRFIVYISLGWTVYAVCGILIHNSVIRENMSQSLPVLYWVGYGIPILYFSYICWKYYKKRKNPKRSKKRRR